MSADTTCTCPWTDESMWTTYGSAVEPGSQREPDPDCPAHRTPERAANAAIIACWATHPETPTPHPGCCISAAVAAIRPVHYREVADDIEHIHPKAARLLRSVAKDLEGDTDGK